MNAKNLEIGFPNSPLTVSFIGDYGQDADKNFKSAPKSNNVFSAYKNKTDHQPENMTIPPTAAKVILFNCIKSVFYI